MARKLIPSSARKDIVNELALLYTIAAGATGARKVAAETRSGAMIDTLALVGWAPELITDVQTAAREKAGLNLEAEPAASNATG